MKPNSLRCTNCMGNLVTLSHPLDPKRRNMCIKCANKETMKKLKQAEWEEIEKKTMKEAQKQKIPHHLIEHTIDRWKVDLSGLIYDMVNHRPNMELGYIPNYKDITNLIDSELSRQRAEIVEEMGKKPTTPPVKVQRKEESIRNWKMKTLESWFKGSEKALKETERILFARQRKQVKCNCCVGWLGRGLWGFHDCQDRESLLDKIGEKGTHE